MHEVLVGNIAVGKDHCVNFVFGDQLFEILLFEDGNTFGIEMSGKFRRITASGDVGNLSGGEGDYVIIRIVAKPNVEIVEVSAGGTKNQNSLHRYTSLKIVYLLFSRWTATGAVPFVTPRGDF